MIYVFLVLLAAVIAWRIILPGMRLGSHANAGATPAAPAGGAVGTAPANQWFSTRMANIVLIVAAVIVSILGILKPEWSNPNPAEVGTWGQSKWLMLLLLWGIGAALVELNANVCAKKTLQMVLAGVVAVILVVFPVWGWMRSQAASTPAPAATARTAEWHRLDLAAGEESAGIDVPVGTRLAFDGDEGIVLKTVYADGSTCITPREACPKKPIEDSRLVNEAATSGKVAYTFK